LIDSDEYKTSQKIRKIWLCREKKRGWKARKKN